MIFRLLTFFLAGLSMFFIRGIEDDMTSALATGVVIGVIYFLGGIEREARGDDWQGGPTPRF